MNFRLLWCVALLMVASSCKQSSSSTQTKTETADTVTNAGFNKMLDQYYEDRLKLFPLEATAIGDERYDNKLYADFTESYHAELKSFFQQYLDSLQHYN